MNKFIECLKMGQEYELELLKHINYDSYIQSKGKFKDYDLEITNGEDKTYYEVKCETVCMKYGNICIEYNCNGKDSGINATKADIWCHFNIINKDAKEYILYIIPIEKLKRMIKNKLYHRDISGGDGNRARFYLFKLNLFDKYICPTSTYKSKIIQEYPKPDYYKKEMLLSC